MRRVFSAVMSVRGGLIALGGLLVISAMLVRVDAAAQNGRSGWTIPPNAEMETSPLTVNASVIAAGRKLFAAKCQRCHGPEGKGDGPDADADFAKQMDLRQLSRAAENPDGVVFYKIWHGRSKPKMPAFSGDLSREQVWAIVAYVQTLRTIK